MVDQPGWEIYFRSADRLEVIGYHQDRVRMLAGHWSAARGASGLNGCQIEVRRAPRLHVGLGAGTQLGLSVMAGLDAVAGRDGKRLDEWVSMADRGQRSGIGSHGFVRGGMLFDAGHVPGEPIGPLRDHVQLPDDWRVVLVIPRNEHGRHGEVEHRAFQSIPPVPESTTAEMEQLAVDTIFPSAARADFDLFSRSIYEYGILAGNCYAAVQQGPFASELLRRRVAKIRELNFAGVGQSSWGPTLYVFTRDSDEAHELRNRLARIDLFDEADTVVTAICRHGFRLTEID